MSAHLALVLHNHLPFVRHPEHVRSLEERWLYEAMLECYLPLLEVLSRLERDGVPLQLTMSVTPPLAAMWRDRLLCERFEAHLARLQALAEHECERLAHDPLFLPVALFYVARLKQVAARWRAIDGDLCGAFAAHARAGRLELIGCSATHAYLPGLLPTFSGLRAQLELGVEAFARAFGEAPAGLWLPECAFHPAYERELTRVGLQYVVVDTHALTRAQPPVALAPHRAALSPSGCVFFARDPQASQAVWSREAGYPGDPIYRDFYRDVGYDLPEEQLLGETGPYGARVASGLKYYRITGQTAHKLPYDPLRARWRAHEHAADFVRQRSEALGAIEPLLDGAPICVAPYDAELFGHWWFEGPDFLEGVFRALRQSPLTPVTLGGHLRSGGRVERAMPEASSWGENGYGDVWIGPSTAWVWRHVHHATRELTAQVQRTPHLDGVRGEALDQAIVELLLLQSSDWPFIIKTETSVGYAEARLRAHHHRLSHLLHLALKDQLDQDEVAFVRDLRARDNFLHELSSARLRAPYLSDAPSLD